MHKKKSFSKTAFSLIETIVSITVVSILSISLIEIIRSYYIANTLNITEDRMRKIEDALLTYIKTNGYLPCPASMTISDKNLNSDFGKSANCSTLDTGSAGFVVSKSGTQKVIRGTVPVKTLSLSKQYMYDKWGRRFAYIVVDKLATDKESFTKYNPSTNDQIIKIFNTNNNQISVTGSEQPAYLLLSYGKSGRGGYDFNGNVLFPCGSGYLESKNCDSNNEFVYSPMPNFVNSNNYFDDIVHWVSYSMLLNAYYSSNPDYIVAPREDGIVVDDIFDGGNAANIPSIDGVYLVKNCNSTTISGQLIISGSNVAGKMCVVTKNISVFGQKLLFMRNLESREVVVIADQGRFIENNGYIDYLTNIKTIRVIKEKITATDLVNFPKQQGLYIAEKGGSVQSINLRDNDIVYVDKKGNVYHAITPKTGDIVLFKDKFYSYDVTKGWTEED